MKKDKFVLKLAEYFVSFKAKMLKKIKKSRRTGVAQSVVRAVQSEGSPSLSHPTVFLAAERQMQKGRSTPDEIHTAWGEEDIGGDSFL